MRLHPVVSVVRFADWTLHIAQTANLHRSEKEIFVPAASDAIRSDAPPCGDIAFIEFWSMVKRRNAKAGAVSTFERGPTFAKDEGEFLELPATLSTARGLTDLCVVACCDDKKTVLGLNWIEFQP